jgi:hypothetical protein
MGTFHLAQALTSLGEQRKAYAVAGTAMLSARALGWGYTEVRLALDASALVHGARGPKFTPAQLMPLIERGVLQMRGAQRWAPPP